LERIDLLALWFLLLFGGFVPYVTIKSSRAVRAGAPIPPRTTIYRNVLIMQAVFLAAALAGAGAGRIDVLAAGDIRPVTIVAAVAMLALAFIASRLIWKSTPDAQRRRLLISRPHGYGEFRWWIPVALAAGTVEEIVYRGVLPTLLMHPITRWLGSGAADGTVALGGPINSAWCLAAGISTVAFVLGHFGQGVPRAVFLAVFSVVCHLLVRTSGSLFLAMAFHVVYDVFAGISSIRAARELEPATGG
jgi:membrane protease YdiL (CAAX protease family)